MQSSDSEFAKPFRLWSNTAVTEIEMTSQSPEANGTANPEKAVKQVFVKVTGVDVQDCT